MVIQFSKYFTEQSTLSPTNAQCHLLVLRVLCMHASVSGSLFRTVCLLCHYDCLTESSIILFFGAAGKVSLPLMSFFRSIDQFHSFAHSYKFQNQFFKLCACKTHTHTPAHTQMHAHIHIPVETFIRITMNQFGKD